MGHIELSEEESQLDSCRKRLKQPTSPHPVAPADNPFTYVHLKMTEEESPRREVPVEKLPVSRARRCK